MRLRTKLALIAALVLFVAFLVFTSERGQQWLYDHANRDSPAYAGWHERAIYVDVWEGISLAPYPYVLFPAIVCSIAGIWFWIEDRTNRPT
jgi:hypothetical protein